MQQYAASFNFSFYRNVLIKIAAVITAASLVIYAVIRLLFSGCGISVKEDVVNLYYAMRLAAGLSGLAFVLFLLIEAADSFKTKVKKNVVYKSTYKTVRLIKTTV